MEETLKVWLKRLKLHESTISMFFGALVVIVIAVLLYNFFTGTEKQPTQTTEATPQEYTLNLSEEEGGKVIPQGLPVTHTVAKGEHLWGISEKYYGNGYNWPDIAQANNITNPGIIVTGQELTIPKVALRVSSRVVSAQTIQPTQQTITGSSYTVIKGDNLWNIAVRAYQDGYAWPSIYESNKELIGSNPGVIEVGMVLILPR